MGDGQSSNGKRRRWQPLSIVGILLGMVVAAVVLPLLPFVFIMGWREHRRLLHRLRRDGRIIDWERAKERTQAGEGLLLVEVQKGLGYAWWVENALIAQSPPCPLPAVHDARGPDLVRKMADPATVEWFESNLKPVADKVMFVKVTRKTLRNEIPLLPRGGVRAVLYYCVRCFRPGGAVRHV